MNAGQELPRNLIVVGGASGIGEATVKAWASRWQDAGPAPRIAICDYNIEAANRLAADIRDAYPNGGAVATSHFIDVTDEESVDRAVAEVKKEFSPYGGIGYLVHSAGVIKDGFLLREDKQTGEVAALPFDRWSEVIDVHLHGTFRVNQAVGKVMIQQAKGGSIVNLSSVSRHGNPGQSAYAAAKAGIVAFGIVAALEWAERYGIRVNTVAPGFTETPMTDPLGERLDGIASQIPLGQRLASPYEIAQSIINMLTETYVTGEVRDITAGLGLGSACRLRQVKG